MWKGFLPAAFVAAWFSGGALAQSIIVVQDKPAAPPAPAAKPAPAAPAPVTVREINLSTTSCCPTSCCAADGPLCGHHCPVQWLKPWTCEDLEMKPVEPSPRYCGCKGLFWCPPKEEEKKENGNGNGDKKNGEKKEGEEAKKEEEKKNGEEAKEEEKPETLAPLMQLIQCASPRCADGMKKRGDNAYGWIWMGFTGNFDSPRDRINFGVNHNWRSNDYRLDQVYLVYENPLEHENELNFGYRVDFYTGHVAPFMVSLGLFSDFTGFDQTSGYGVAGPASFRQLNRIGIDLPQFWVEAHVPCCLTEKGIDVRVGKFWTLMGHEVYLAPLTEFYSRSYEIMYATPFAHTGVLTTVHATDTVDVTAGIVVGADVFEDNNNRPSYIGNIVWNSCDKRYNWTTAWNTGPEQFNNNDNYRTVITSYLTAKAGSANEWTFIFGGNYAFEANIAVDPVTGGLNDAEWYGLSGYLLYTVDPRLILGTRLEWFRDDDGVRTAVTKRPGFAANFYEVTLGATYKPYQNLWFRPEIRFDWSNGPAVDGSGARPYNDLSDGFQTTVAIDMIWQF
jgi:hypothetical protein